jgi:hypothetical protein
MEYFSAAGYNKCVADPAGALPSMKNPVRNRIPTLAQARAAAGVLTIVRDQPAFPPVFTG